MLLPSVSSPYRLHGDEASAVPANIDTLTLGKILLCHLCLILRAAPSVEINFHGLAASWSELMTSRITSEPPPPEGADLLNWRRVEAQPSKLLF